MASVILGCHQHDSSSFTEENTLESKLFVFGSQIDHTGDLILYVHGTDVDDNPLTVNELKLASIELINGEQRVNYVNDGLFLNIQPVTEGDKILSLAFVTDYSGSMTDDEINTIGEVYKLILENLPMVYELQVINFSDLVHLRLDWTDASPDTQPAIFAALKRDDSFPRNGTALYDAIGTALLRDLEVIGTPTTAGDGLIERCRPAHMMVVFSDGLENWSRKFTDRNFLISLLDASETVAIMLGTQTANQHELEVFAGDRGAVVSVHNTTQISSEIVNWATSLQYIATFRLSAATDFNSKTINIILGDQAVTVIRPRDELCEIAPGNLY